MSFSFTLIKACRNATLLSLVKQTKSKHVKKKKYIIYTTALKETNNDMYINTER